VADVDCIVIGGGVVGLACARTLAQQGREVVLLERHGHIGEETSSRNSEVIHAGIYYPEDSQKAALCVRGKQLLYAYCEAHGVAHSNCGKIIVAVDETQISELTRYQQLARNNAAGELQWLSAAEVSALEPEVQAVAGLLSPTTGIIDSHAYMLALQGDFERAGGVVALATLVADLARVRDEFVVNTSGFQLTSRCLINSGGLHAPVLARQLHPQAPQAFYARGHYYSYRGKPPFSRLVYPIAEPGGLGVHVTLDLAHQIKFGPDVEWTTQLDYSFDDSRREAFAAAISRYFPGLEPERLEPGYVGIRPKISGPGQPAADFRIDGATVHGIPGLINLLGIESPGLTASLAIAERVAQLC